LVTFVGQGRRRQKESRPQTKKRREEGGKTARERTKEKTISWGKILWKKKIRGNGKASFADTGKKVITKRRGVGVEKGGGISK